MHRIMNLQALGCKDAGRADILMEGHQIDQPELLFEQISDETIHAANAAWLEHDYPTDVLAFEMDRDEGVHKLEGNILVSSETAAARAPEFGWGTFEELMLYIIHGTLHLVGFDDHEGGDAAAMRQKENEALAVIGIKRARP